MDEWASWLKPKWGCEQNKKVQRKTQKKIKWAYGRRVRPGLRRREGKPYSPFIPNFLAPSSPSLGPHSLFRSRSPLRVSLFSVTSLSLLSVSLRRNNGRDDHHLIRHFLTELKSS